MSKNIQIIATEETYNNLVTFNHIDELNTAIRLYKERFSAQLTKSTLNVLDVLQRYSAKHTGVSFLRKNKIAGMLGITRQTVIRACKQLESFGIIKQYEMKRTSDMQQTANAIVIQPVSDVKVSHTICKEKENVTQAPSEMLHQENNIFLKQKNNIKDLMFKRAKKIIKYVPKQLQHFSAIFSDDLAVIWKRILFAARKLKCQDKTIQRAVGFQVMQLLTQYVRQYVRNNQKIDLEALCKLAYTIAFKKLENHLKNENEASVHPSVHSTAQNTRQDTLPKWMTAPKEIKVENFEQKKSELEILLQSFNK